MKKFVDDDGNVHEFAYVNGYLFGDRLLENVMFECVVENDAVVVRGVMPACRNYFNQLNCDMWLAAAREFVKEHDVFSTKDNLDCYVQEVQA